MPTSPGEPEPKDEPDLDKVARFEPESPELEPSEEARLVNFFEGMMVRHEQVNAGPSLTPEQVTLALGQQEAERQRSHELAILRARQRHEAALARQKLEAEQQLRKDDLRRTRLTFLPRIALGFGGISLLGTALIIYVLVRFDAKDQIPVVLAFLSGLLGGILAGFGLGRSLTVTEPDPKS